MNEGMLSPESRDLLDKRMDELKKLMPAEDHEDLPAYREAIVTLSLMGNVCFTEVADILYYLLSANFHGWAVLPTLKAIMGASAKAGITARRAFNALSIFIGAGFELSPDTCLDMDIRGQIPAAYPTAFNNPSNWQEHPDPVPNWGETVGYGPPRDFQAESEKMFAERTEGTVGPIIPPPLEGKDASELFADVRSNPELWTDALLYKLARQSTVVHYFLMLRAQGGLSHEQTLVGLILYLTEEKRRLIAQVTDFYMKFPVPLPFPKDVEAPAEETETGKEKG